MKNILSQFSLLCLLVGIFLGFHSVVYAWYPPLVTFSSQNTWIDPLDTEITLQQSKLAGLIVNSNGILPIGLDVRGKLMMTGGSTYFTPSGVMIQSDASSNLPASGKILTSSSDGIGRWESTHLIRCKVVRPSSEFEDGVTPIKSVHTFTINPATDCVGGIPDNTYIGIVRQFDICYGAVDVQKTDPVDIDSPEWLTISSYLKTYIMISFTGGVTTSANPYNFSACTKKNYTAEVVYLKK